MHGAYQRGELKADKAGKASKQVVVILEVIFLTADTEGFNKKFIHPKVIALQLSALE